MCQARSRHDAGDCRRPADPRRGRAVLLLRQHRSDRRHRLAAAPQPRHAAGRCVRVAASGTAAARADPRAAERQPRAAIPSRRPDAGRHHHRLGRPDRIGSGAVLRPAGPRRRRHRQRHARATSSAPRQHRLAAARRSSATCRAIATSPPTSATPTPSAGCSRATARDIALVVHAAAQPSHDWAAREPITDFTINANGTLVLLERRGSTAPTRRSSSPPPTRSTATRRTGCRWSSGRRAGRSTDDTRSASTASTSR